MMERIEKIHSGQVSVRQNEDLLRFCRIAEQETKHASSLNMAATDWQNNPASLLYLLHVEKRFLPEQGALFACYLGDELTAVSGYYRSDFDPQIYLFGVRSWVLKEHRMNLLLSEKLVPLQFSEIRKSEGRLAVVSFNDETKAFARLIERANRDPEAPIKFFFGARYPEIYRDMKTLPYPVKIKNTRQWVLIKEFEPHTFDWNQLKCSAE